MNSIKCGSGLAREDGLTGAEDFPDDNKKPRICGNAVHLSAASTFVARGFIPSPQGHF
jgi:hypothetical protein